LIEEVEIVTVQLQRATFGEDTCTVFAITFICVSGQRHARGRILSHFSPFMPSSRWRSRQRQIVGFDVFAPQNQGLTIMVGVINERQLFLGVP
jgi:hypothetical protein